MKTRFFIFSAFLSALIIFPAQTFAEFKQERLFYTSPSKEKQGIADIKKNYQKIDILAPQVYIVLPNLTVKNQMTAELYKTIQDYNLKTMPLLANDGFNQKVIHDLLISETAQNNIIDYLVKEGKEKKYIGWQFDFENINYKDKDLFSVFIEKTAKKLHENGMIFSVAAVARITDYENTDHFLNWAGAFDYKRIAEAVDFVSLMTYDDPNSLGPASSIPFINSVLAYVKDKIPAEKLSMGIPLYYWGWTISPYKRIRSGSGYSRLSMIMQSTPYLSGFIPSLGTAWLAYSYKNFVYLLWHENGQSFDLKLNIVKQNNFRGFSAWALGDEDPALWNLI